MASIMKRGRFLLRPLQVQRPFRQALRGMGKLQDQEGGAGAQDHGRERTAGRHLPRPRHHDGGGDAVQMDPDPVQQSTSGLPRPTPSPWRWCRTSSCRISGKRKVQDLRTYDIEKFYATLCQDPLRAVCARCEAGAVRRSRRKRLLSSTSIHEVHTLLKTAFSYAVEWDLIHKIAHCPVMPPRSISRNAPSGTRKPCWQHLQTIENPALHLAVHMSMILSLA